MPHTQEAGVLPLLLLHMCERLSSTSGWDVRRREKEELK